MPVVYRTIRKHLILSMGGRAATFVNLKTFLQPGVWQRDASYELDSDGGLLLALQHIRPQITRLVREASQERLLRLNPRCTFSGNHYSTPIGVQRQLGQFASGRTCLEMLLEHERSHSLRFDFMTRVRPDMAVPLPVPAPFPLECDAMRTVYTNFRHNDWLIIAPRDAAAPAFDLGVHYANCTGEAWWGGVQEVLLSGAIKRAGFMERHKSFPLQGVNAHSCPKWCARETELDRLVAVCK